MNRSAWSGRVTSLAALLAISTAMPLDAQEPAAKPVDRPGGALAPVPAEPSAVAPAAAPEPSLEAVKAAIDRGANWLIDHQLPDGSYGGDGAGAVAVSGSPGITAIALHALAICPRGYREEDGPFISKAVEFLLAQAREGGGIYAEGQGLENYESSMALLALDALDAGRTPKYADRVVSLREFIAGQQCAEETNYHPDTNRRAYGGIGYGSDRRPDLSNTQVALDALHAAELADDSDVYRRVQLFLTRCQNRAGSNDFLDGKEHSSTEDGGFFYYPGESKAENRKNPDGSVSYTSYGSMTYAGVKSLIFAGVSKDDPRVRAAVEWIGKNFTVEENPGMATPAHPERGQMGLYYYYAVMARTFEVLGEKTVIDGQGRTRRWAAELAAELLSRQSPEGSWSNPVDRWWEANPSLVTAYAVQALTICARNLKE
jgi:squalene-hopene/tetraprenyl-beta-curcumene cyclase